jgi:hypothetical protein
MSDDPRNLNFSENQDSLDTSVNRENFRLTSQKIVQIARQIHGPGDLVEAIVNEVIPRLSKDRIGESLSNIQKTVDYIFRHGL